MWPFSEKKQAMPQLEFTERQTSPYAEDNVTVIHTGSIVRGTITKTKYGTWKATLQGSVGEFMNQTAAEQNTIKKWATWYDV